MVFKILRELLAEQAGYDEKRILPETSLRDDLQMELMDLEEVMILLEQEFPIEWTEDDLSSLETVDDLTVFIENQDDQEDQI